MRVCVLGHFLSEVLTCAVSLCVSNAVRRDSDVCDVAAYVFVAQSSEICAHAVSLRVRCFRALVAAPFLSFESCKCAVHVCACSRCSQLRVVHVRCFFCVRWIDVCGALGACPRLWRVGRGSVFVFACVFLVWFFVRGRCTAVDVRGGFCKVFGVSVCVFLVKISPRSVRSPLARPCSAKSSHFVRDTAARVEGWHDLLTSTSSTCCQLCSSTGI